MLDYHDGVALIAEFLQGIYELYVVSLMEAYARLIQNVKHVYKTAADLCGKPYPLAFSPAEGCGGPVQRQVIQSYGAEESHPVRKFLDDISGN